MVYRAFVSSTYKDLKEHRSHVIKSLRKAGFTVDPMEDWTAATDEPKQFSQDRVKGCDLCVLVVGFRRGHIPMGHNLSITQLEYEAALKLGIDVLVFMLEEEAPWPRKFDELDKDPEIRIWRDELMERKGIGFFETDPSSIEIGPALTRWITKKKKYVQTKASTKLIKDSKRRSRESKLTPMQRKRQIEKLLKKPPGDSIDGLPEGLLSLINDVSYIRILEEKLDPNMPTVVLKNAINTIGLLADWEWDHRQIKSPSSITKLIALYKKLGDDEIKVRKSIIRALMNFSGPEIPFSFLIKRLAIDPVEIKAEILANLQFYVDRPYLAPLMYGELLPLLHEFCRYEQVESIYSDEYYFEMDFRFWVFRCLGGLRKLESAEIIKKFIENHKWPLEMLAEAANAHWDITHTVKYVDILKRAKKEGVAGNTEHALKEIEEYQKRFRKGKIKKKTSRKKTVSRKKLKKTKS
jgi:hypothetical protein